MHQTCVVCLCVGVRKWKGARSFPLAAPAAAYPLVTEKEIPDKGKVMSCVLISVLLN